MSREGDVEVASLPDLPNTVLNRNQSKSHRVSSWWAMLPTAIHWLHLTGTPSAPLADCSWTSDLGGIFPRRLI